MQRQKKGFRIVLWILGAGAVVLFVALAVATRLTSTEAEPGGAAPTTTTTATPEVTPPPPTPGTEGVEEFEPDSPAIPVGDCRYSMTVSEYTAFIDRLLEFETISQMPESQARLNLMVPLVTDTFLESHKTIGPVIERAEAIVVTLDKETSALGCLMGPNGTITAHVVAVVVVSRTNTDGTTSIVNGPLTLAAHYTNWVQLKGAWYVNQEQ